MKPVFVLRFFNMTFMLIASAVFWNFLTCDAYAQYSDNLKDIAAARALPVLPGMHKPTPIGNLGNLDVVVDLRGFVPMSFVSLAAMGINDSGGIDKSSLSTMFQNELAAGLLPPDQLRWYKIPTKKALLMLYSGDLALSQIADDRINPDTRFGKTSFLKESDVKSETALWCKLAYKLAKESEPLFQRIAGDGFDAAEPTTVFLTDQSAFVILSFRYKSLLRRNSTGQVLVAMEFSRSSKEYKTFYNLYSTTLVSRPVGEAFVATAPIVARALFAMYTGQ